ncbi:serine/threonine protein kinase [Streptomyces qinglanensis]|uniref:Serine/threonine protein kinase n=1 Tax=Streptomyces qinglanensis TaxID=943816 RepID=A0A1E7K6W4_9ACTN|nr:ATP-binding protein [Streptomyces qinglanensis]OEU99633.1 serine/threonine protein kinase [Streptomyces qinglanensis]OEV25286.1 serine/threonine protein kinase [Streptomyces nanshensis]OEV25287.1 serine/threonine protein kinase [Streptomyces nanshensis]
MRTFGGADGERGERGERPAAGQGAPARGRTAGPAVPGRRAEPGKRPPEPADGSPGAGEGTGAATHPVRTDEDLLLVRHAVRAATVEAGLSLVDQTRVVTAASELARNAYVHGGGGALTIEQLRHGTRCGVRLTVRDEGPGIDDLPSALADGYTTGAGLGHGLGGARRLMHEFEVRSEPGSGAVVTAVRWSER